MATMRDQKTKFHHFSHEHPLELTNSSIPKQNKTCAGCKHMILSGKDYYACPTCHFSLHQVCYNMPRKTRHASHPNHHLSLYASSPTPASTKGELNCQACGNQVTGFHYNCAECRVYYHTLCSALPFSVSTSSHPHALKLTFSPPFDLCCDLCNEPGYDEWLYRCHICEFDTHVYCAISNQTGLEENQIPTLPTNAFSRFSYENYSSEGNELLQLVRQKVCRGNIGSVGEENVVSSKQEFNGGKPNLVSEDNMSMTPSYQFSDACFSIDLAKSYSSYGQKNHEKKEIGTLQGPKGTSDVVSPKVLNNLKPEKQGGIYVNGPGTNYSNKIGSENKMNEAFLIRSDTLARKELGPKEMKRKGSEKMGRSTSGNQNIKSDTEMSAGGSCWQSVFGCCN